MSILLNRNTGRIELISNKKSVLCEICGKETEYNATKRCDSCWSMEQGLRMLADKDKTKAIKWLEDNLKKLKGTK